MTSVEGKEKNSNSFSFPTSPSSESQFLVTSASEGRIFRADIVEETLANAAARSFDIAVRNARSRVDFSCFYKDEERDEYKSWWWLLRM